MLLNHVTFLSMGVSFRRVGLNMLLQRLAFVVFPLPFLFRHSERMPSWFYSYLVAFSRLEEFRPHPPRYHQVVLGLHGVDS